MFDLDWVQRLIRIVDESDIDTLEVSRFATKIRISKSPPQAPGGGGAVPAAPPPAAGPGGAGSAPSPAGGASGGASAGGGSATEAPEEAAEEEAAPGAGADLHEVTSPMVGTFYRAPAPDAPAYVEVGDRVEEGQTLCILEAMKLMNELDSEVSGVVREICVENAEPVEYGDVLFRIDTDA